MSEAVLDASAVLALLQDEPGADRVRVALAEGAIMSTVNYSEVIAKFDERGGGADARETIEELGITLVPFSAREAEVAGLLRGATKSNGLSLGDRACLALGITRDLPILTADRVWREVAMAVPALVEVIR